VLGDDLAHGAGEFWLVQTIKDNIRHRCHPFLSLVARFEVHILREAMDLFLVGAAQARLDRPNGRRKLNHHAAVPIRDGFLLEPACNGKGSSDPESIDAETHDPSRALYFPRRSICLCAHLSLLLFVSLTSSHAMQKISARMVC
jgi:hypothetical protein